MTSPTSPQQAFPHRSMTSGSDDMSTPVDDPSETTRLLQERLQAYKHACGYFEDYISSTEKMHHSQIKEYEKILKTVNSPLKENHHFDGRNGGVAEMFDTVRTNTQALANSHAETAKTLKATVLPIFERLHAEIKNKSKELSKGVGAASKSVDKARDATQKHVGLLGQNISAHRGEAANDPYVLQKGIRHRLNKQLLEEANTRQDMLSVQNSFSTFETHVVQVFQEGMTSFMQTIAHDCDQTKSMYNNMTVVAQSIQPTTEWDSFVARNNAVLIDPNAPVATLAGSSWPNKDHPSTQPLIEGSLERKSGLTRSFSPFFYAVTPAKYLHEYKTDDDLSKDPTPEMSLYLPDVNIGGCNGNEFSIKGKDAGKAKIASKVSSSREFSFRAHTKEEAEMWWGIIRSMASSDSQSANPSSPISSRDPSGTYQAAPQPLQTQQPVAAAADATPGGGAAASSPGAVDTPTTATATAPPTSSAPPAI